MILIEWYHLMWMLVPLCIVAFFMHRWGLGIGEMTYATVRMVVQLVAIGYVLVYLFNNDHPVLMSLVLSVMIIASGWITLRHVGHKGWSILWRILVSIALAGLLMLGLIILVIGVEPWYQSRFVIPLAGMIFSVCMNSLSQYAERWERERNDTDIYTARNRAFKAALIPKLNNFFAVGLVALPGMMTGQILSGVSPLIAVRYQIMIMAMMLGAGSMAVIFYSFFTCKQNQGTMGE